MFSKNWYVSPPSALTITTAVFVDVFPGPNTVNTLETLNVRLISTLSGLSRIPESVVRFTVTVRLIENDILTLLINRQTLQN